MRWDRAGFRAYWRWRSRPRWGRPKAPLDEPAKFQAAVTELETFLRNHAEGIAALDLFVVPTGDLRMLFALVIVAIDRRLM